MAHAADIAAPTPVRYASLDGESALPPGAPPNNPPVDVEPLPATAADQAPLLLGDMNCDGTADTYDIDAFVLALTEPDAYADTFPECLRAAGDVNGDGKVDTYDIDAFVAQLAGDDPLVPPAAGLAPDAGGPYLLDPAARVDGGWQLFFDGSASTSDTGIASWSWLFPPETFEAPLVNSRLWDVNSVQQFGAMRCDPVQSGWDRGYALTKEVFMRDAAPSIRARFTFSSGNAIWGFKNTSATIHQNQFVYGIYFFSSGLYVYENGASRGKQADFTPGQPHDVRIDVKPAGGARYYAKATDTDTWTLIYDSTYSTETELLAGFANYDNLIWMDDFQVGLDGETVARDIYGPGTATLTIADPNGLTAAATAAIMPTVDLLLADAGGPYIGTSATRDGSGWNFTFDATASQSTYEIVAATWDLGFDDLTHDTLAPNRWFHSAVTTDAGFVLDGGGGWGSRYLFERTPLQRGPGVTYEARLRCPGAAQHMWGLKDNSTNYSYAQMPYAIYLVNGGIQIYESGAARGTVGAYPANAPIDLRIELKPDHGARYYYRPASDPNWVMLYESDHSGETNLLPGVTGTAGRLTIERVRHVLAGMTAAHKRYHGGSGVLTVYDAEGRVDAVAFDVTLDPPTPTFDVGGPYAQLESDPNDGLWTVALAGSVDSALPTSLIWDLGPETFAAPTPGAADFTLANAVIVDGVLAITGATWGSAYAFSETEVQRADGVYAQARLRPRQSAMWGFKNTSGSYHYNQLPYAMYFNSGNIGIYEDGAARGNVSTYTQGDWYDVRIELRNPIGAKYFVRPAGTATWQLIYDSGYSGASPLRPGIVVSSGVFLMDDVSRVVSGEAPTVRLTGPTTGEAIATDYQGQHDTQPLTFTVAGAPPVADAGGTQSLSESNLLANGFSDEVFDGGGSTDDVGIVKYEWEFPAETFSGTTIDPFLWITGGNVSQNDGLTITGASDWSNTYAYSRQPVSRVAGQTFECEVSPSTYGMFGFKNTSGSYHYNQLVYAIYFNNNSSIYIYENGASRGSFGSYDPSKTYEIRIALREGAGAIYSYREKGAADWNIVYVSAHSAETDFLVGCTIHSGTFTLERIPWRRVGQTVTHRVTKELDATLTVCDILGQTDTDTAELRLLGTGPLADAGPSSVAPLGATAILDGSGSVDDVGIKTYEWDFGDGATGSGEFGEHVYNAPGVYNVTLTVYDAAGRSDTDTTVVEVKPMVVTVPWDYDNVSGLEVPHNTWDGLGLRLKAVVFTDTDVDDLMVTWQFGDGAAPETTGISDKRVIETFHTYNGAPGALFTARVTVHDPNHGDLSDVYPVQIHSKDLSIEVNVAIEEGLWYLHKTQESDGKWRSYSNSNYFASATSSSLHAMTINGHQLTRSVALDPLVEDVARGFDYLFTRLNRISISPQAHGNPDSNGNGYAIQVSESQPIYQGGMVMDALAASGSPGLVAQTGPVGVVGLSYRDIAREMGDGYAWGQVDSGTARGGWRYSWNSGSDNSAAQWGAIGFLGIRDGFGLSAPQFVIDENLIWLAYSQNAAGWFGYSSGGDYHNKAYATTPSGMVQLAFCGVEKSSDAWVRAETWIADRWNDYKTYNYVYGWYAFAKAMRLAEPTPVTVLPNGVDWYNDSDGLVRYILNRQNANGSWPNDGGRPVGVNLHTAWQVVILTPTLFTRPPVAVAGNDIVWAFDRPLLFDASESYHTDPVRVLTTYEWDFDGDGTYDYIGSDPQVEYTFAFDPNITYPTTYQARLRVTDDIGQLDTDSREIIIAEPPHAPHADAGGPYTVTAGVPFYPDGSASFDIDPSDYITRQEWDFDGDDGYDFDNPDAAVDCLADGCPPLQYVFNDPGIYNIGLRVWDNGVLHPSDEKLASLPDFTTVTVVVNVPPVAVIADPDPIAECSSLTLDGSGSYDDNGDGLTYAWDLDGDGQFDDSTSPAPSYTWNADGQYTVGLVVSDGALDSQPAFATVTVLDTTPAIVVTGPAGLDIDQVGTFDAAATSPCDNLLAIEWDWDYNGVTFAASADEGPQQSHSYAAQGTYEVAARVTDSDGSTALDTITVVVNPPGGPRIAAGPRIEVIIGVRDYDAERGVHRGEFSLLSKHDDPIYGPIALAFDELDPATVRVLNIDGTVPDPNDPGQTIPFIDFSDLLTGNKLMPGELIGPKWIEFEDPDNIAFTFDALPYLFNGPPRITSSPLTMAVEGQRYRYDVDAVDDDGDPVNFFFDDTAPPPPAGMTIHPLSGLIDWTPGQQDAGDYEIYVVASDGYEGGEAVQVFTITVEAVNVPPIIVSTPLTTGLLGAAYEYDVDAEDPDGDALTYALDDGPGGMTIDPGTGLVSWPAPDAGLDEVIVRATDTLGNYATQSYLLRITDCATPPTIADVGAQSATEGTLYELQIVASTTTGDPISYSLPTAPTGMEIDAAGLITWNIPFTAAGLRTVKVVATTSASCRAELIFQLDVADANGGPAFVTTPPTTGAEDVLYAYNAKAEDPDGEAVAYRLVTAPDGMDVDPLVGRVTWRPSQMAGSMNPHAVVLEASDPGGAKALQTFDIVVDATDLAPVIVSTPAYGAIEAEPYVYDVEATDADGDPLTFALDHGPGGMSLDPNTGLLEWLPGQTAAALNPYSVSITVSDPAGHTDTQAYNLYVRVTNVPPTITSTPNESAVEGAIYRYLVTADDEDGDDLTFALTNNPTGMSINPNSGLIDWLVDQTAAATGPHAVTVRVSDGIDYAEQSFDVTADAVNVAPNIFSEPELVAAVGAPYAYQVEADDNDDDPVVYALDIYPTGMDIDPNTGLIEWLPAFGQDGNQPVTVRATDPAGLFGDQSFIIAVAECPDAPIFTTDPVVVAQVDTPYVYDALAEVGAGTITYELTDGPVDMDLDPNTGTVTWTPTAADLGVHPVTITALRDAVCPTEQVFTVEVRECTLIVDYLDAVLIPNSLATWVPQTTANCDPLSFALVDGPPDVYLDPVTGIVQWIAVLGPFTIEIEVSDAWGNTETVTLAGTVQPQTPPQITSTPTFIAGVNMPYTYDVEATDAEGDALTYSLDLAPGGMVIDPNSGLVEWTPVQAQIGTHQVKVRVDDARGAGAIQTYTLAVSLNGDNSPPEITSTPTFAAAVDAEYSYQVTATDDDPNDVLTFGLDAAPAGAMLDPVTGLLLWTPSAAQIGSHAFTVRVEDGAGGWATQAFTVAVSLYGDNTGPQITSEPTFTAIVEAPYVYTITATDADNDPLVYRLTTGPSGMTLGTDGRVRWTPTMSQLGTHDVAVRVEDGRGGWASQAYKLTVSLYGDNVAPRITSTPLLSATVAEPYAYQVYALDDDGDPLTFALRTAPQGMTISNTGLVAWTPTAAQIGTHTVELRVEDGRGGWAAQTFTLPVSLVAGNHAPQIVSTPLQSAQVNVAYAYTVVADDEDGDALSYALEKAPAGAMIDAAGSIDWTPTPAQLGTHTFKARVEDGVGGWATQTFDVAVSLFGDNVAPEITSTPTLAAQVDVEYTYQILASDADGDTLSYALFAGPDGMAVDAASGLLTFTPTISQVGTHSATVRVEDGKGGWAMQTFTLAISEFGDNTPPQITSTPLLTAAVGVEYRYEIFAIDDDGDALSYTLDDGPAGMSIAPNGVVAWTPSAGDVGTHLATVSVDDSRGGYATQTFYLTVSVGGDNRAPQITSDPPLAVVAGDDYAYAVFATDPDGDSLTYELDVNPSGMAIDASGLITWTTAESDIGDHDVTVRVEDGAGGWATQSFVVSVRANSPPQILSTPVVKAIADVEYLYAVEASDVDGQTLEFELTVAPTGMVVDPQTGEITWTATVADAGLHDVTLVVRDSLGAAASQSYELEVYTAADADVFAPEIVLSVSPKAVDVGGLVLITAVATDDFAVASLAVDVDGTPLMLESGQATYTPTTAGVYVVTAVAVDLVGHTTTETDDFYARLPGDDEGPTVVITTPDNDATLSEPTDIVGTASDDNLYKYVLEYRNIGEVEFVEFATGYDSVSDGVLGQFDTSMLQNGQYELRLLAEDTNGNLASDTIFVTVEGDRKVGNFTLTFTDLEFPLVGIPISVARTYDSRNRSVGDFGHGWTMEVAGLEIEENRVLGEDWEQIKGGGFIPSYGIRPLRPPLVSLRLPDGRVEKFALEVLPQQQRLYPITFISSVRFVPVGPTKSTLQITSGTPDYYDGGIPGTGNLISLGSTIGPFDPTSYRLTRPDGTVYTFAGDYDSQTAKLTSITDVNGNKVQFTDSAITHSAGKSLQIERDGAGRVTKITDPAGAFVEYEYDGRGDLVAFTNREGDTTEFTYNKRHGLLEVIDPRGVPMSRNIYDDDGRLIAVIDSKGNRVDFVHDTDARQQVTTDRRGFITVHEYDEAGNVTAVTNHLGHRTEYTYDARGNVLTEKDPEDRVMTKTWDELDNLLSETDFDGNTTTYTYDANQRILSKTDPEGYVTSYEYDAKGNRTKKTDPDGGVTTYTHDANGRVLSQTGPRGYTTTYGYDSSGNLISETNALGAAVVYTYDDNGNKLTETRTRTLPDASTETVVLEFEYDNEDRMVKRIAPGGEEHILRYNEINKHESVTNANNQTISYEYDLRGNEVKVTYPDGSTEEKTYDAEGNLLTETDRDGNTTTHEYDEIGRKVRTIYPDLAERTFEYDDAGRLLNETDERGKIVSYAYGPNWQEVTDPNGDVMRYEYDGNGNDKRIIDAQGRVMEHEYDGRENLIKTTYPDGSFVAWTYDAAGNKTSETDQAGLTTTYEYDALGQLVTVIDALGGETSYEYDEMGNRIAVVDAAGRRTEMEYSAAGRLIKRILPLGQEESWTHDPLGRRLSHTDFNGKTTEFEYDFDDHVTLKRLPDGTEIVFAYTPAGDRLTAGDDTFTYDARHRMLTETRGDGQTLVYAYDDAGNRTSVTTSAGATAYAYDDHGRLETVTDPNDGVTTYAYDKVGNRRSVTYPNNTRTSYTYDALNRLTQVATTDLDDGSILAQYDYDLGPAGHRLMVTELSGRTVEYEYDDLHRLTRERITAPGGDQTTLNYTYDAVGNRLTMLVDSEPDGTLTDVIYMYDDNDRLMGESREVTLVAAPRGDDGTRIAGRTPKSSAVPTAFMGLFLLLTLTPLVLPLRLLFPRRRGEGQGHRRRRIFNETVTLLVIPMMLFGPDLVWAQGVEAIQGDTPQPAPVFVTYTYDDNGNTLTRDDGTFVDTFTYDDENRMTSADMQSGGSAGLTTYSYDADDHRRTKTYGGDTTTYVVDRNRPLAQVLVEQMTGLTVSYVHGDDLISQQRNSARTYYVYDGTMSTRALTDTDGAVTDTYVYDAFGRLLDRTGSTSNVYRYTGEQYDPNAGFYYLRARYYNPESGRFTTRDAYENGSQYDPFSLHKYLYANADPVNNWDPTGQFTMVQVMVTMAIVTILGSIAGAFITGDVVQGLQIGLYFGLSVGCLALAFIEGKIVLAIFMGIVQGALQMLIDGVNHTNNSHALVSFAKGWLSGTCSVAGSLVGLPGWLVAGLIQLAQEIVDAITTGTLDLEKRVANIIVAMIAAWAGGHLSDTVLDDLSREIFSVLFGLNVALWKDNLVNYINFFQSL